MAGPSGGLPDLQTTLALASASSGGNSNEGGNVNDSKRKHECLECGKHFPTPSKLQRHSFIHMGEKPYNCKQKHECLECGKRFPTPSKLQRHSFIHTGEKPHNCPHCPKSYSQLVHLKNHLMSHEKQFAAAAAAEQGVVSLPETVGGGELSEGPAVVEVVEEAIQLPDQFKGDKEDDEAGEEETPLKGTSPSGEANHALAYLC